MRFKDILKNVGAEGKEKHVPVIEISKGKGEKVKPTSKLSREWLMAVTALPGMSRSIQYRGLQRPAKGRRAAGLNRNQDMSYLSLPFESRYWPLKKVFDVYERSMREPEEFWAEQARQLDWFKTWDKVLEWQPPFARWFVGGQLNVSYICVDRHVKTWRRSKVAIYWEGEPGESGSSAIQLCTARSTSLLPS